MKPGFFRSEVLASLLRLRETLRQMHVRMGLFTVAVMLAAAATVMNVFILQGVMALSNGLIRNDFEFVRHYRIFRGVAWIHPAWFQSPTSFFLFLLGAIYLASLLKNSFTYTSSLSLSRMMALSSKQIRLLVFRRYLSFGKLYLDQVGAGRLHHVLMKFSNEVAEQISALHRALKQCLLMIAYVYLMVKISVALTAILVVIAILFNGALQWLVGLARETSTRMARAQVELNQRVLNILGCIPLIKSNCRERAEEAHFAAVSQSELGSAFQLSKEYHLQPCLEDLMLMTVLVVIAAIIGYLARNSQSFRIGDTFMFLYLVKIAVPTFSALREYRIALARADGPLTALCEMLDDEGKVFVTQGSRMFTGLQTDIRIESLSFAYRPDSPTLRDVSCVIEKGKMTAIVGASGAGKSTLAHLLMRFYDCAPGTIRLDGVDIRDFTLASIMSRMALVTQDIQLFNDTLRRNLLYGIEESVSEEMLVLQCKRAGIYWLIQRLPEGFETEIGERGIRLSGGEKQRLALARAFLKNPEILILDEATSSLDAKAEAEAHLAIERLFRGRTIICITHRLSTVKRADNLIVIEKGTVVETGRLADLIDRRGHFFEYWDTQRAGFEVETVA